MRLAFALVPLFAVALQVAPAHAEGATADDPITRVTPDAVMPTAPEPRTRHVWYGWQTLIADASAVALLTSGWAAKEGSLAMVGAAGYFVGGPVVHWSRGRVGRGFASLGLRIAGPVLGDGLATANELSAIFAGCVGAMLLDAAALTHETVQEAPKAGVTWAPTASITRHHGLLGLSAAF